MLKQKKNKYPKISWWVLNIPDYVMQVWTPEQEKGAVQDLFFKWTMNASRLFLNIFNTVFSPKKYKWNRQHTAYTLHVEVSHSSSSRPPTVRYSYILTITNAER